MPAKVAFQTVAERKLVAETVIAHVNGRVPIIVHIGAAVLNDATHLARHAQEKRQPHQQHPAAGDLQPAGGCALLQTVAAAAPENTPFLPYLLGVSRDVMTLMHEMAHIPTLAGTKYTGPNMYEIKSGRPFPVGGMDRLLRDG